MSDTYNQVTQANCVQLYVPAKVLKLSYNDSYGKLDSSSQNSAFVQLVSMNQLIKKKPSILCHHIMTLSILHAIIPVGEYTLRLYIPRWFTYINILMNMNIHINHVHIIMNRINCNMQYGEISTAS